MSEILDPIMSNPAVTLARELCLLFLVIFTVALVFWTFRDARRRGAMSGFWAFVVLLFNVAGWAIYMVVRPPEIEQDARERDLEVRAYQAQMRQAPACPACHTPIESDFEICPVCMKQLRRPCTSCGRPLKLDWGVCPYCRTKQ